MKNGFGLFLALAIAVFAGCSPAMQEPAGTQTGSGQSSEQSGEVLARVGDRVVTVEDFMRESLQLDWKHKRNFLSTAELKAELLKKLVDNAAVLIEGDRDGTTKEPEFLLLAGALRESNLASYYADRYLSGAVDSEEPPADLPGTSEVEVDFGMLRLRDRAEAEKAMALIREGKTLRQLVREHFSASQVGEGRTGFLARGSGMLPPHEEDNLFALDVGETSGIFEGLDGFFYIVEALERKEITPEDVMRDRRIEAAVRLRKFREDAVTLFHQDLREKNEVRILYNAIQDVVNQGCIEKGGECLKQPVVTDRYGEYAFEELLAQVRLQSVAFRGDPPSRETPWISLAGRFIDEKGTARAAVEAGLHNDPFVIASYELLYLKLFFPYLREKLLRDVSVSEREVEERYQRDLERLIVPESRRFSHILVKTREQAVELYHRLQKGEDFAELARRHSIHESADRGGDLGRHSRERNFLPFGMAEIGFSMKSGEVSQPAQSAEGYHLVRVDEVTESHTPSLEEAVEQLREMIRKEREELAIESYIERARSNVEITIDEEKFEALTLPD